jgi:MFS family permease
VIVFSLVGGVVADTLNRRKVMFITQSGMALTAAGLAALSFSDTIQIWHIYALTALQALFISFDLPARQSLVPNLVPARDLANAFSMTSIAFNTGAIFGPLLSGLVIAVFGQAYTYLFNAISFGAVLLALILMGPAPQQGRRAMQDMGGVAALGEGVRFIFSRPIILSSMLLDFFATFFSSANTMLPIIARDILKVGETGFGVLSAAQPVGSVITSLALSQAGQIRRQGPLLLGAVVVFGLATIAFGLAPNFALAVLALIVMGNADALSTIIRNTIRQLNTPDTLRGRMTSINQVFFMGGPQLGEVEAGLVASLFGVPAAIVSGGLGCILAAAWIRWRWPELAQYHFDPSG